MLCLQRKSNRLLLRITGLVSFLLFRNAYFNFSSICLTVEEVNECQTVRLHLKKGWHPVAMFYTLDFDIIVLDISQ